MERGVEIFVALNLIIMGLSHIFAPNAWKEFFTLLHSKGEAGSIANSFLSVFFGTLIVAFHPRFDGVVPSLLTVYGWLLIIKSTICLLVPSLGVKSIETPTKKDARLFVIPGILLATLGVALLAYPRF